MSSDLIPSIDIEEYVSVQIVNLNCPKEPPDFQIKYDDPIVQDFDDFGGTYIGDSRYYSHLYE
jgi:hypothetical protein